MTHQTTTHAAAGHAAAQVAAGEAMDWLAGRLRWERVLRELHDQAEGVAPVAQVEIPTDDDRAA
jgi:hypothetical protein